MVMMLIQYDKLLLIVLIFNLFLLIESWVMFVTSE